jgi:hypothetical protein
VLSRLVDDPGQRAVHRIGVADGTVELANLERSFDDMVLDR